MLHSPLLPCISVLLVVRHIIRRTRWCSRGRPEPRRTRGVSYQAAGLWAPYNRFEPSFSLGKSWRRADEPGAPLTMHLMTDRLNALVTLPTSNPGEVAEVMKHLAGLQCLTPSCEDLLFLLYRSLAERWRIVQNHPPWDRLLAGPPTPAGSFLTIQLSTYQHSSRSTRWSSRATCMANPSMAAMNTLARPRGPGS